MPHSTVLKTGIKTLALLIACTINASALSQTIQTSPPVIKERLEIGRVPSGFPVGFCLLTEGTNQFVAFYDAQHQMTVASRTLDSNKWMFRNLPSKVGWDSHNYITMTSDSEGYLHLSGNMHCNPLIYFRTAKPRDITTFEKINKMTGENENMCTYPKFMRDDKNRLIFHYRDGFSGDGLEIYNIYDTASKTWKRMLDTPLINGRPHMNAYMSGPFKGPDGFFHIAWVWRDTPDCATNHDPSYAKSRNLINWETIDGTPVTLPITPETKGVIIDPVPVRGGIINGSLGIGFNSSNQPVASYHKHDSRGNTQVYAAQFENGRWIPHQLTDWNYRWEFNGGGSITFEIRLGRITIHDAGKLALEYNHIKYGKGLLIIDEKTLELLEIQKPAKRYPPELTALESDFPDMYVSLTEDSGTPAEASGRYILRWETLPHNRDRPRSDPLPEPSALRLYRLSD